MEVLDTEFNPEEYLKEQKKKEVERLRSQRDEKVSSILKKINTQERRDAGYKDMTALQLLGRVKRAFNQADTGVLYLLEKKCDEFDNFGKGFYYWTRK